MRQGAVATITTMRRILLLMPLLFAAPPATADAAATHAFTGSCVLTGELTSPEGAGWVPGTTHWDIDVRGTCTGVLDGTAVTALSTSLQQTLDGRAEGCLPAGTATAAGVIDFGRHRQLAFTGQQALVPVLVMTGAAGGTAVAVETAFTMPGGDSGRECTSDTFRRGAFEVRIRADQALIG